MAVGRMELTPSELDWVVRVTKRALKDEVPGANPHARRAVRELERCKARAFQAQERERAHTRAMKKGFRTANPDAEPLDYGQRNRKPGE